ncbi:MAG: SAM-dependent methyltransferase [Planctomycetaceae bacterium]
MSEGCLSRSTTSAAPAWRGDFLLVACQGGAERAVAARQAVAFSGARQAAWRRGLVTFRLEPGVDPSDDFFPADLVFGRACLRSLGQVTGSDEATLVAAALATAGPAAWENVHVWNRVATVDAPVAEIRARLLAAAGLAAIDAQAEPGDLVLDVVIDAADRWWVGWHRAASPPSCWAGGIYPRHLPEGKVSRAWLKLDEAIATFRIGLQPGERAIELGAAPGGACQRLLEAGLDVVAVDPALVDERVAAHPRFEQWRMRARDVRLRRFRGCDWLVCDMNIDPRSTLAAIERVVTAPGARPRGIVATLKLPEWSRAAELPAWLAAFGGWGYRPVARQLSTGGREICVVARRDRSG